MYLWNPRGASRDVTDTCQWCWTSRFLISSWPTHQSIPAQGSIWHRRSQSECNEMVSYSLLSVNFLFSAVFMDIPTDIPSLEGVHVSDVFRQLSETKRHLIKTHRDKLRKALKKSCVYLMSFNYIIRRFLRRSYQLSSFDLILWDIDILDFHIHLV